MKKISVIVPVYNVEPYLERCIDSILSQTRLPDEIICVDDGSTDGSGDILDHYAERFDIIKVIHKANGGLVSARKAGLAKASGDYATYVDSDDWIEPNMYEEMMHAAEETNADIITSDCIHDYGSHQTIEREKVDSGYYDGKKVEDILNKLIDVDSFFSRTITVHLYNKLFERNLLNKHQMRVPDEVNIAEDVACTYPCFFDSTSVYVTGGSYYHYCFRSDSMVGGKDEGQNEKKKRQLEATFEFVKKELIPCSKRIPTIEAQIKCQELYSWLLLAPQRIMRYEDGVLYPYGMIEQDDRVAIYGAGSFGYKLKEFLEKVTDLNIVAWVDKSNKDDGIITPQQLLEIEFDKVLIAILLGDVVNDACSYLAKLGLPEEKIYRVNIKC